MPLDDLLAIVLRAGVRTPTPSGLRSALRAAHRLVARYAPPELPPDDDGEIIHVIIPVSAGERWCAHCGEVAMPRGSRDPDDIRATRCCRRPQPILVTQILQPEEYYLRQ